MYSIYVSISSSTYLQKEKLHPYVHDSNVTKLLANMLTSNLYFIIFRIVSCNLVSIKIIIIIIIIIAIIIIIIEKWSAMQGRESTVFTLSVRRPQPHNTDE